MAWLSSCVAQETLSPLEKPALPVSREILALSCPVSTVTEVTSSDSATVTRDFEPGCFFHPFKKWGWRCSMKYNLAFIHSAFIYPGTLSTIMSSYRRVLSCAFVRATESCLLARLGHLDAGARGAAARRRATVREEELSRAEAAAHHQAYIRGRGGPRRGRLPFWFPTISSNLSVKLSEIKYGKGNLEGVL